MLDVALKLNAESGEKPNQSCAWRCEPTKSPGAAGAALSYIKKASRSRQRLFGAVTTTVGLVAPWWGASTPKARCSALPSSSTTARYPQSAACSGAQTPYCASHLSGQQHLLLSTHSSTAIRQRCAFGPGALSLVCQHVTSPASAAAARANAIAATMHDRLLLVVLLLRCARRRVLRGRAPGH